MDQGVLAAIRLLPRYRKSIEELVLLSESFRSLCGDIAEAELALQRWENSTSPGKEARCAEYRSIINGLEAELRQAIHERQL
jgi:hypothetical protein